jgi:hypothetical protein
VTPSAEPGRLGRACLVAVAITASSLVVGCDGGGEPGPAPPSTSASVTLRLSDLPGEGWQEGGAPTGLLSDRCTALTLAVDMVTRDVPGEDAVFSRDGARVVSAAWLTDESAARVALADATRDAEHCARSDPPSENGGVTVTSTPDEVLLRQETVDSEGGRSTSERVLLVDGGLLVELASWAVEGEQELVPVEDLVPAALAAARGLEDGAEGLSTP